MKNVNCYLVVLLFSLNILIEGKIVGQMVYKDTDPNITSSSFTTPQKYINHGNGVEFIPNKGQVVDANKNPCNEIMYVGDGGGNKLYLRKSGISIVGFSFQDIESEEEEAKEHDGEHAKEYFQQKFNETFSLSEKAHSINFKSHRLDINFTGANTNFATKRFEEAPWCLQLLLCTL